MTLYVQLLGEFHMAQGNRPVTGVKTPRLQSLLAYLLLYHHAPQPRQNVAFQLWPDSSESQARTNLRKLLFQLRRALPQEHLHITSREIQWNDAIPFRCDALELRRALETLSRAPDLPDEQRRQLLVTVADTYTGQLLPACYDAWIEPLRRELHRAVLEALDELIQLLCSRGELRTAIHYARRFLELDPLSEEAYRRLMRFYAASGDRASALAVYHQCTRMLQQELGVDPSPETEELHQQLRDMRSFLVHNNLPAETTPFVGRRREVTEIARLLDRDDCRLITVIGPGGMGKTRLAIRVARERLEQFEHGVCFTPLASVTSGHRLVAKIARGLRFTFQSSEAPQEQLLNYLRERELLLILDNFEHLVPHAGLITAILQHAPRVKVLVTSQIRLNLQEEWLFPLHGLRIPDFDQPFFQDEELHQYSAVRLFLENARRVDPGFRATGEELAAVLRICSLVGGMPLGVELAAAWVQLLTCQEIADEIERNWDFLTSSLQNIEPRHRSIRAVFEHAWRHLTPEEQAVFRRLSVFRGGFQRQAGEEIAGASLHTLVSFMDKSLVQRSGMGRYQLHGLLRQFALEKLRAHPDEHRQTRRAHARFFTDLVHRYRHDIRDARALEALQVVESELENIRAAWQWSVEQGFLNCIYKATDGLGRFYETRSYFQEGVDTFRKAWEALAPHFQEPDAQQADIQRIACQLLSRQALFRLLMGESQAARVLLLDALERSQGFDLPEETAFSLSRLAEIARTQDDYAMARRLGQEALAIYQSLQDPEGVAHVLNSLGVVAHNQGNYQDAWKHYQESYRTRKRMDNPFGTAQTLGNLGRIAQAMGRYSEAHAYFEESLEIRREIGDQEGEAYILASIGATLLEQGEYQRARELCTQGLAIFRAIGYRRGTALALGNLGDIARILEEYAQAARCFRQALELYREMGSQLGVGISMISLGRVALAEGNLAAAQEFSQEALRICQEVGYRWGESFSYSLLGQVALLQEEHQEARLHLGRAFRIARAINAQPLIMEVNVGLATLLIQMGEPEAAVELLTQVARHASATKESQARAQFLLERLASSMSPPRFRQAQERARSRSLSLPDDPLGGTG